VNALWQQYQACLQQGNAAGFIKQYTDLLMAGGTERYDVALQRFDLDARQAAFWSLGLDMISDMIDELESLT
jgi:oligoendopeptidase F